jgi:hypothetical protein
MTRSAQGTFTLMAWRMEHCEEKINTASQLCVLQGHLIMLKRWSQPLLNLEILEM